MFVYKVGIVVISCLFVKINKYTRVTVRDYTVELNSYGEDLVYHSDCHKDQGNNDLEPVRTTEGEDLRLILFVIVACHYRFERFLLLLHDKIGKRCLNLKTLPQCKDVKALDLLLFF
jgi:hypothetical protein